MYGIQVKVRIHDISSDEYIDEWRWVHPTKGPAYRYDTKVLAENMARMYYSDQMMLEGGRVRIQPFPGELGELGIHARNDGENS